MSYKDKDKNKDVNNVGFDGTGRDKSWDLLKEDEGVDMLSDEERYNRNKKRSIMDNGVNLANKSSNDRPVSTKNMRDNFMKNLHSSKDKVQDGEQLSIFDELAKKEQADVDAVFAEMDKANQLTDDDIEQMGREFIVNEAERLGFSNIETTRYENLEKAVSQALQLESEGKLKMPLDKPGKLKVDRNGKIIFEPIDSSVKDYVNASEFSSDEEMNASYDEYIRKKDLGEFDDEPDDGLDL